MLSASLREGNIFIKKVENATGHSTFPGSQGNLQTIVKKRSVERHNHLVHEQLWYLKFKKKSFMKSKYNSQNVRIIFYVANFLKNMFRIA